MKYSLTALLERHCCHLGLSANSILHFSLVTMGEGALQVD